MSFPIRDANTATPGGGKVGIQPGRPDALRDGEQWIRDSDYDTPRVLVVDPQGNANDNVMQRGRRIVLRGEWTLRQYRNPVPCGAQFGLHPGPGATYQWEVLD